MLYAMTSASRCVGGIATANLNVLRALTGVAADRGGKLTIFSFGEGSEDRPAFLPDWVCFRGFRGDKASYSVSLILAAVRRPLLCFDHVHLALPVLPLAAAGVVRTVIFAHGSESWKRAKPTSRWSIELAALCLTNSEFTLRKMRERIGRFNGVACPLGLSPEFPLNAEAPGPSGCVIELPAADGSVRALRGCVLLLVARMDPGEREKGHAELIGVMPALVREFPDVQLVFVGPGDDRERLAGLARATGVGGAVFVPGFVSAPVLEDLYRDCYAFVMPSRQEGFGLSYLEAMNYAKPCVGCFDQGAEDVILHGQTGLLVADPHDRGELVGVLRALLADPERARSMGRQGLALLHERFTSRHHRDRVKRQIAALL